MIDEFHLPGANGAAQVFYFEGTAQSTADLISWQKPRGKSMIDLLLVGKGGNGGSGAIGANSAAAGGGGGGSGAQTRLTMPIHMLPDIIYLNLAARGSSNTLSTVLAFPASGSTNTIAYANSGGAGGNATGATAGAAGAAGVVAPSTNMPLGYAWATVLAGQVGIIGGVAIAGGAQTTPTSGLIVMGGTGGGGLPAAATAGTNGGGVVSVANTWQIGISGGLGDSTGTAPAGNGQSGFKPLRGHPFSFPGTGGGSTHGTATGAGLQQSSGGNGGPGCGGGGSGGALTGSAAGSVGLGGSSFCVITVW